MIQLGTSAVVATVLVQQASSGWPSTRLGQRPRARIGGRVPSSDRARAVMQAGILALRHQLLSSWVLQRASHSIGCSSVGLGEPN